MKDAISEVNSRMLTLENRMDAMMASIQQLNETVLSLKQQQQQQPTQQQQQQQEEQQQQQEEEEEAEETKTDEVHDIGGKSICFLFSSYLMTHIFLRLLCPYIG